MKNVNKRRVNVDFCRKLWYIKVTTKFKEGFYEGSNDVENKMFIVTSQTVQHFLDRLYCFFFAEILTAFRGHTAVMGKRLRLGEHLLHPPV